MISVPSLLTYFSRRGLSVIILAIMMAGTHTCCFAGYDCTDWMNKGGYCVDYVKSIIPAFPIPQNTDEIEDLKNKNIPDVTEGDVALFSIRNYWHAAYVENVHRNQQGDALAIDVREMNFGDQLTFAEFKSNWKSKSTFEWQRAIYCGVTDDYGQTSTRKNVALNTVTQIWSPDTSVPEGGNSWRGKAIVNKVREVLNRIFEFTGREL